MTDPTELLMTRLRRGLTPCLVVGHQGTGKSHLLRAVQDAAPVQVVFLDVPPSVQPERLLYDVAYAAVRGWVEGDIEDQPTPFLVMDLRASDPAFPQGQGRSLPPAEIALAALDELRTAARVERIPVLLDGLDRLAPPLAQRCLRELAQINPVAQVLAVVSPAVTFGDEGAEILSSWRVFPVSPLDPQEEVGRARLAEIGSAGLPEGVERIEPEALDLLITSSGGVLRDLLELRADAIAWGGESLTRAHVEAAVTEKQERLRRRLQAGDIAALRAAEGSDGLEVPADRKARLLHLGLLLEYGAGVDARVRPHPLLRPWLTSR